MQTLEPAFEQLNRIQVLGSYQIVASEDWRIALHRHPGYVSERKTLLMQGSLADRDTRRAYCQERLQQGGIPARAATAYCQVASTAVEFFALERCAKVLLAMIEEEVLPHVAVSIVKGVIDSGATTAESTDLIDWCEIAIHVCRQKKRAGQALRNSAGLLVKIVKDLETRSRAVSPELEASLKVSFRRLQEMAERQDREDQERTLLLEYEEFRMNLAEQVFQELPETGKAALRKQKAEVLRQQERFQRIPAEAQEREIDAAIVQDLARKEAPQYEKWRLRKQAQQAVLAFVEPDSIAIA
jgi:hypothetical protein